jgi:hypothetical protein
MAVVEIYASMYLRALQAEIPVDSKWSAAKAVQIAPAQLDRPGGRSGEFRYLVKPAHTEVDGYLNLAARNVEETGDTSAPQAQGRDFAWRRRERTEEKGRNDLSPDSALGTPAPSCPWVIDTRVSQTQVNPFTAWKSLPEGPLGRSEIL